MGFSRQEYWSGLPFPSPDLPNPGIEPGSPALQTEDLPSEPPGKPKVYSLKESQMPPTKQMYNTALAQHTLYMLVGNHLSDSDRKEQRVLFLQFFKLWWNTHKISMFLPLKKFYWGIVDLQCVSFKYTVNWISYTYTLGSSFSYRLLQSTQFPVLYRSLLVIYFILSGVYVSIPIFQFIPPQIFTTSRHTVQW